MSSNRGTQLQEETLRELAEIIRVGNLLHARAQRISQVLRQQFRQAMEDKARREEESALEPTSADASLTW